MDKKQIQSITARRLVRRQRKRRNQLIRRITLSVIAGIVLIVFLACIVRGCVKRDTLAGIWDYDDITAYQFDGNGEGALLLPDSRYMFDYEINEDQVHIDFEDEDALDYTYQFVVEEETLILSGGEGEERFHYELNKRKGELE